MGLVQSQWASRRCWHRQAARDTACQDSGALRPGGGCRGGREPSRASGTPRPAHLVPRHPFVRLQRPCSPFAGCLSGLLEEIHPPQSPVQGLCVLLCHGTSPISPDRSASLVLSSEEPRSGRLFLFWGVLCWFFTFSWGLLPQVTLIPCEPASPPVHWQEAIYH